MKRLRVILGFVLLFSTGCAQMEWDRRCEALLLATNSTGDTVTIPLEHIPSIKMGISIDELREVLKGKTRSEYEDATGFASELAAQRLAIRKDRLAHQFTVQDGDSERFCVSSTVIRAYLYFLFEDGRLIKIIKPRWPTGRIEYSEKLKARVEIPDPIDYTSWLRSVLHDEGFSAQEYVAHVKQLSESQYNSLIRDTEPNLALEVAFGLSNNLSILMLRGSLTSQSLKNYKRMSEEYDKYNPFLLKLGMSLTKIEGAFGRRADMVNSLGDETTWIYEGEGIENYGYRAPLVAVVFRQGSVVAIFSNRFVGKALTNALPDDNAQDTILMPALSGLRKSGS